MKRLIGYRPAFGSQFLLPPHTGGFLINLSEPHTLPRPTQRHPKRKATFYPSRCPVCEGWYSLRKEDAIAARKCRSCHCRTIGRKGYDTTVERWGKQFALKHVQAYQLEHPSTAEQMVAAWLDQLGVPYERQSLWSTMTQQGDHFHFLLDFVIGDLIIEVNGPFHNPDHRLACERRIARDRMLESLWEGTLLILDARQITTRPAVVRHFLIEKLGDYLEDKRKGVITKKVLHSLN